MRDAAAPVYLFVHGACAYKQGTERLFIISRRNFFTAARAAGQPQAMPRGYRTLVVRAIYYNVIHARTCVHTYKGLLAYVRYVHARVYTRGIISRASSHIKQSVAATRVSAVVFICLTNGARAPGN